MIGVSVDPSYASYVNSGISKWMVCGTYGTGIPTITANQSGDLNISVRFDPGKAPPDVKCGSGDRAAKTITIYKTSGEGIDCQPTWSETVAHELGHFLGLNESSCTGYIMGPNTYTQGSRSVKSSECAKADAQWKTSGDPYKSPPPPSTQLPTCDVIDGQSTCSPIVINFESGPLRLTGSSDGVRFDLNADGKQERIGWTQADADAAFLAFDWNFNGRIDDGSELFGTSSFMPSGGRPDNGFEALRVLDENGDGVIDRSDPMTQELLLWTDRNHDGISQPDELRTFTSSSVLAIELGYHFTGRRDRYGNTFRYQSQMHVQGEHADVVRSIYDIYFIAYR